MIRLATTDDIPRLLELLHQVNRVHADLRPDLFKSATTKYDAQQLRQILSDPLKAVFVSDNVTVDGYAFVEIHEIQNDRLLCDKRTLYVDDICVDEAARGQHIGRQLFEQVRHYAETMACSTITLNVWEGNTPAMNFYRNLGMQIRKTCMELQLI